MELTGAFLGFIFAGTIVYFLAGRGVRRTPPLILSGYRLLFAGLLLTLALLAWNQFPYTAVSLPTASELAIMALVGLLLFALPQWLLSYAFKGEAADESAAAFIEGIIPGLVLAWVFVHPPERAPDILMIPLMFSALTGLAVFLKVNPLNGGRWKVTTGNAAVLAAALSTSAAIVLTRYLFARAEVSAPLLPYAIKTAAGITLTAGLMIILSESLKKKTLPAVSPPAVPFIVTLALTGTCLGWVCFLRLALEAETNILVLASAGLLAVPVAIALANRIFFRMTLTANKVIGSAVILASLAGMFLVTLRQ